MSVARGEARSRIMRAIKSKDTAPELTVRRYLHAAGYRFRLHRADLPGRPDIVLPKHKAVIFVHGCFWHQHSSKNCRNGKLPQSNTAYWTPKLSRNLERDTAAAAALRKAGWRVLTVWECETKLSDKLEEILQGFLEVAVTPDNIGWIHKSRKNN